MNRTDIINALIKKYGYTSYLEIGICDGTNFRRVKCDEKVGVDPEPMATGEEFTDYLIGSDEFFKQNKKKFDIIFVDGLHHSGQVYRDIVNGLECLKENGSIVCHDMSPIEEIHQRVPRETRVWNGDCWKAWMELRQTRDDLNMKVVNTDWGCGVIRKGEQETVKIDCDLTYENLTKNRKDWLNLVDVGEFLVTLE